MEALGSICRGLRRWRCTIEKSICRDILTFSAFFSFWRNSIDMSGLVDIGLVVNPLGNLIGLSLDLAPCTLRPSRNCRFRLQGLTLSKGSF